ncbi:MAG: SMP-30/gluconolactonase/LRE family protein [Pseudomonadota bacterium]
MIASDQTEPLTTTIHAQLPTSLSLEAEPSAWYDQQRRGRRGGSFLEGPSFDRDGNLYLVDIPYGRILKLDVTGAFTVVTRYHGQPNGLKIHPDGRLFVADYLLGIMEVDPISGNVSPFIGRDRIPNFKGCNDLVFAANGELYFTDQGMTGLHDPTGRLYRFNRASRLECLIDNIPSPNGLVLDPSEEVLYLAVTRANAVWRVPFLLDGSPGKVGLFAQFQGPGGPDGLAMDSAGNLSVVQHGSGKVWLLSPLAEPIAVVHSCAGLDVTNLAYGGSDNRELFITESRSGTVLKTELTTPGQPMYSHR